MDLTIYRCKSIYVERHSPDNANAITLAFTSMVWSDHGQVPVVDEMTIFDLPKSVTDALIAALADKKEPSNAEPVAEMVL